MTNDIIGFGGGGKGGGEQHTHYEASDSLHSISYARVLDLISEGEILGLASGLQSVYLNETPYQNADNSFNFKDATIDFRTGTQSQDYIPGFPDVESEIAVGLELRSTAPWVHAVTNLSLSAIRITLGVPALSKADTTNGDINGYNIDYKIELSTDSGAYATVITNSFNGKTTSLYERSARIDLPPATTGWSVRVTRLTANASTSSINDTTNIVSYTEVIDAKLRYPMSALVGVQIDAKQFSSIPTRAYDLYGRIIQVPTNYDPVARTYTGVWDGTFKPAWTSNPAWIFRDLVLNDRYGLGNRITAAQIDKWALYAISQYCDQMVSNGKGGTEPRFTCNVYIQSQKAAYAVLQDLASVFRGISYWGGGSIMASSDRPSDPVYVYTAANVIGGKFSRVGTSKKTRYTVALVSWNDPADFYRAKVEYVEDPEGIQRYGIQQVSLTAFGCTSQGQAQRAGRWALTTSRLETDVISFSVGLDGAIALPGQIVRIADPSRMGRRVGGRIRTAAGRVVTLDKAPTVNAGDKLTAILPSGVSETHNVVSISGDAVTVDADWSVLPLAQSVWSVDSSTLVAPTFKVLHVTEKSGGLEYSITATQHEPGKFAFVDSNTKIVTQPQTALDVSKQAAPASVAITSNTVSLNDVQKINLSVSCGLVDGAVAYEGAYKRDSGNWIGIARQSNPTFDIPDVLAGTYTARLVAVNSVGITSPETVSTPTVVTKSVNAIYNAAASLSNAQVFAYQRSASTPTGTPGAITYDFTIPGITTTTLANGWQKTIPTANGNPLYVTVATASGAGSTDTIASTEWAGAVILAQDGPGGTGTNGLNTATATIFQRGMSATAPALPTVAATYNFGSATPLTGLNNGWSATVPVSSGGPYLFVSTATASSISGSDSIAATEWASVQLLAQDGANGVNGTNIARVFAYQRPASAPAGSPGAVDYDFASNTITTTTLANGWQKTIPTANGNPLYVAVATASSGGTTDNIASGEWSGAVILSQDGAAAALLDLNPTAQSFTYNGSGVATPSGQSITLTANLQNVSGTATFVCTKYNAAGASLGSVTLGGSGNVRTLTDTMFTTSASYAIITATLGALSDTVTIVRLADGAGGTSALAGYLTNEAVTVPTAADGSGAVLTGVSGSFKVFQGTTDVTSGCTFAVVGSPVVTTAAPTSGTGAYSVTAVGAWGNASLTTSVTYRATHTASGATIDQLLTITKAPAGVTGPAGLNNATVAIYQRAASATAPSLPSATTTYTFATGALTGLNNGWTQYIPTTGGAYLHTSLATAAATTATDTIGAGEWAAVTLMYDAAALVAAQNAADSANSRLDNIASDNILSPSDKPEPVKDYSVITSEQAGIDSLASSFGITTEKTDYDTAVTALTTYLGTLTGWNTIPGSDVTIVGTAFRSKFSDVYARRQILLNAIAAKTAYAPSAIIGGRNLYPDSGFERGTHPCTGRNSVSTLQINSTLGGYATPYAGTKALFFDGSGTAVDMYVLLGGDDGKVIAGKNYVLSFMYLTSTNNAILNSSTFLRFKGAPGGDIYTAVSLPVLNTAIVWTLCEMPFTCPAGATSVEFRAGIGFNGYAIMAVDCIQIEEGNKRTQWMPAPEDVAADTADAKAAADAAANTANAVTTTINSPPVIAGIGPVSASVYKPAVVIATIYPSVSGGVGPYRYDWSVVNIVSGDGDASYAWSTVTYPNDKLVIRGLCLVSGGSESTDTVTVTATDSKGRTSTTQFNVSVSG